MAGMNASGFLRRIPEYRSRGKRRNSLLSDTTKPRVRTDIVATPDLGIPTQVKESTTCPLRRFFLSRRRAKTGTQPPLKRSSGVRGPREIPWLWKPKIGEKLQPAQRCLRSMTAAQRDLCFAMPMRVASLPARWSELSSRPHAQPPGKS